MFKWMFGLWWKGILFIKVFEDDGDFLSGLKCQSYHLELGLAKWWVGLKWLRRVNVSFPEMDRWGGETREKGWTIRCPGCRTKVTGLMGPIVQLFSGEFRLGFRCGHDGLWSPTHHLCTFTYTTVAIGGSLPHQIGLFTTTFLGDYSNIRY